MTVPERSSRNDPKRPTHVSGFPEVNARTRSSRVRWQQLNINNPLDRADH